MQMMLRAAVFIVMLAAGTWPIVEPFMPRETVPTTASEARADHAELQCFAEGVLQHTEAHRSVRFILPKDEIDGGLVNHRLRYVVPGRRVTLDGPADYVASWRAATPTGTVMWSGCGGVLTRP